MVGQTTRIITEQEKRDIQNFYRKALKIYRLRERLFPGRYSDGWEAGAATGADGLGARGAGAFAGAEVAITVVLPKYLLEAAVIVGIAANGFE